MLTKPIITKMTSIIDKINNDRLLSLVDNDVFYNPKSLEKKYSQYGDCKGFDWVTIYLYMHDLSKGTTKTVSFNRVCAYLGIEPVQVDDVVIVCSPSVKIKAFGGKSLAEMAKKVDVPLNSLRNWFSTKPIIFHLLLLFYIQQI